MLSLFTSDPDNPQYLEFYTSGWLERAQNPERADQMLGKRCKEAAFWVARLEKVEPDSFRTTRIKARLLKEQNREQEAVRVLQAYASKHADQARLVASVLEQLGQKDEANQFYLAASRSGLLEDTLAQAGFLSRQGRLSEALDILEARWEKENRIRSRSRMRPWPFSMGTCPAPIESRPSELPGSSRPRIMRATDPKP